MGLKEDAKEAVEKASEYATKGAKDAKKGAKEAKDAQQKKVTKKEKIPNLFLFYDFSCLKCATFLI